MRLSLEGMADSTTNRRRHPWNFIGAGIALAITLLAGARIVDGWLSGALWLVAWALLAHGVRSLAWKRSRQVVVTATFFGLVLMLWNYTARQPRIRIDGVVLRTMPSTVQPGVAELMVRNTGDAPARIVVLSAAHLAPLFRNAQELNAAGVEEDVKGRLDTTSPTPATGTMVVDEGETAVVIVEVPFSERAWQYARGDLSVIVAARIQYRDRVFQRERVFCQFGSPQSGEWKSCPFLNE